MAILCEVLFLEEIPLFTLNTLSYFHSPVCFVFLKSSEPLQSHKISPLYKVCPEVIQGKGK